MASSTAIQRLKEDIMCSICLEPMTEPMAIDCGHTYCHSCITRSLESQSLKSPCQGNFHCPVCRAEFQKGSIRPIKQLENLIHTIKEMEKERLCESHGEKLHLFCEDDDQLICWCCERSPQHTGHVTVLVEDACKVYKEIFQKNLMELRKLQDKNKQWQVNTKKKIRTWQIRTICKRNQIKCDFEKFDTILQETKKSCLWQLENIEEDVLQRLQNNEAKLKQQSLEFSNHILELERKCQGSAQDLMQDVRSTWNRISALKLYEPEDVSLDIDTMYNVSECYLNLRKLFKTYNVIITLDSDTAHKDLRVSKSKRSVIWGYHKKKIDTPERFRDLPCVLGHQIFNSGSYLFKVILIKGTEWDVGVCLENVPRDNDTRDPESGFWAIRCCKESRYEALTSPPTPLHLKTEIHFISVFLDYDIGLVSFYDSFTNSHIFTFPKASFSGPLKAYFCIGEGSFLFLSRSKD